MSTQRPHPKTLQGRGLGGCVVWTEPRRLSFLWLLSDVTEPNLAEKGLGVGWEASRGPHCKDSHQERTSGWREGLLVTVMSWQVSVCTHLAL